MIDKFRLNSDHNEYLTVLTIYLFLCFIETTKKKMEDSFQII
jgi:hypothetical protein